MNRALMIWLSFVWLLVNNLYGALAGELSTTGAYSCLGYDNSAIEVTNFTFSYIEGDNSVNYTVDAISDAQVNVTGEL